MMIKYNFILQAILFLSLSIMSLNANALKYDPEMQGESFEVEAIDVKKGIIKTDDVEFVVSASTRIYDHNGEEVSIKDIEIGQSIKVFFNPRFISRPTLTKVYLNKNH